MPLICLAALAAPAQGASGTWDRAWGKDVDSVAAGTGFEVCTVAASCKGGDFLGGLGGEMTNPFGVATDAAGNVYLAEEGNNRIQKFDSSGNFLAAWGKDVDSVAAGTGFEICTVAASCKAGVAGGLGGEMSVPARVATDAAGNVYLADRGNHRIQRFDSSGNFLRAWGKDVDSVAAGTGFEICTVAASCKAGSTGVLGGEMNFPRGVATDAAGNVYLADFLNSRIQRFDSSGNFLRAWGKDVDAGGGTGFEICTVAASCQAGSTVTELGGEMSGPAGVATHAGNVYVADSGNSRIQKFDSAGNFLRAWGKDVVTGGGTGFEICTAAASCKIGVSGGLGGEMNAPQGVATNAAGNLYLADFSNQRIQKFDSAGNFVAAWGKDVDSVAAGTGFEICTVAASCKLGVTGGLGGEMSGPQGLATDAAGNVYLADQFNHRIQKFADPLPPPPTGSPAGPTGKRAAALKKCKKKKSKKARKKCKRKANKLPV